MQETSWGVIGGVVGALVPAVAGVILKVMDNGECTVARAVTGLACCTACPDYEPESSPPDNLP